MRGQLKYKNAALADVLIERGARLRLADLKNGTLTLSTARELQVQFVGRARSAHARRGQCDVATSGRHLRDAAASADRSGRGLRPVGSRIVVPVEAGEGTHGRKVVSTLPVLIAACTLLGVPPQPVAPSTPAPTVPAPDLREIRARVVKIETLTRKRGPDSSWERTGRHTSPS